MRYEDYRHCLIGNSVAVCVLLLAKQLPANWFIIYSELVIFVAETNYFGRDRAIERRGEREGQRERDKERGRKGGRDNDMSRISHFRFHHKNFTSFCRELWRSVHGAWRVWVSCVCMVCIIVCQWLFFIGGAAIKWQEFRSSLLSWSVFWLTDSPLRVTAKVTCNKIRKSAKHKSGFVVCSRDSFSTQTWNDHTKVTHTNVIT